MATVVEFRKNLKEARIAAGLSQVQLATVSGIQRGKIVRFEAGQSVPSILTTVRLAAALKLPLEVLINGRFRPARSLRGIAFELHHLGIRDFEVADPIVPGAFRRAEHVLVLALRGDRPEARIIDAIPFVLARRKINVSLTLAFAKMLDARVTIRLAWLSDVLVALSKRRDFPGELVSEKQLEEFIHAAKKPKRTDSLGHPREGITSPIWRRWGITYASTLEDFLSRMKDLDKLAQREQLPSQPEE